MNVTPGLGPIMGVGMVAILFPVFVLAVFFGFIILLVHYVYNTLYVRSRLHCALSVQKRIQ